MEMWRRLLALLIGCVLLPAVTAVECYSGSQLQVIECPSLSCIKQSLGLDTVRYCDGMGVSSICQTYRIFESCDTIPDLGFICCCTGNLCNSAPTSTTSLAVVFAVLLTFCFLR